MSKLTNQWIELFRAGKHGEQGKPEFSTADLDQIVANYQPTTGHEAPATIGHIKGDAPAWGWFEALKRQGDLLLGKMSVVQPEFEEMVEKKLFPKRSVGLVKGENGWGLHHVAFLCEATGDQGFGRLQICREWCGGDRGRLRGGFNGSK